MRIDAVFSGGGVKAYAYLGVLESLAEHDYQIVRVAGTSAGAIISAFLAAGFTTREIGDLMHELDTPLFMDPPALTKYMPFTRWLFLYYQMGLYKGDKLEEWVFNKLGEKNIYTFKDLKQDELKIIVSDLTLGKLVVIPDDLDRVYGIDPTEFSIATAVRMSAGFPYFFMPKRITSSQGKQSIIVDGGLLSNFPLWVFPSNETLVRPVLGVKLTENNSEHQNKTNNAIQMFQALFLTMKTAHDTRFISKNERNNIIFIPTGDLKAMQFNISETEKEQLVSEGRQQANMFLKKWPH
ncbi:patatin-like phospholipase family protein [Oceanobacillus sp. CAU 1775]